MTMQRNVTLAMFLCVALAACSGSSGPTCSYDDPAQLAGSIWPKFRADRYNSGAVVLTTGVSISTTPQIHYVFPCESGSQCYCAAGSTCDPTPKGPFVASPVINGAGDYIYIGSVDGTEYALSTTNLAPNPAFNFATANTITSTALVAKRSDGLDAVFIGGFGLLYGVTATGDPQLNYWPYTIGGLVSASPTLNLTDGTVYSPALGGGFDGVCPNGVKRFVAAISSSRSSPAMGTDGTVYFGSDDGKLRAFGPDGVKKAPDGLPKWTFSASAPVLASPAVDQATGFVYVADRGGRVFQVDGQSGKPGPTPGPTPGFAPAPVAPISSSPALANGQLYFGADDGNLYAINTTNGAPAWPPVATGGSIVSSPAVAINGYNDMAGTSSDVIVVGSTDGDLYFIHEDGTLLEQLPLCPEPPCTLLCEQPPCAPNEMQPIESSPTIGADGTVYIGTDGGYVYAIK